MIKKRKRLAQWVCTDNEQLNIDGGAQRIVTVFFDVISMLVFVIAARMMLSEIFGFGGVSIGGIIAALFVALIASGVMEYIDYTNYVQTDKKKLTKVLFLVSGIVLSGIFLFVFKIGDKIVGGLQKFLADFLQKWNVYYDTNMSIPKPKVASVELGVTFAFIIITFVAIWLAKYFGRKLLLLIIPLLVIALEVTVGYAPGAKGIVVMFIGIVITNIFEFGKKEFKESSLKRTDRGFEGRWMYGIAVSVILAIVSVVVSKFVTPAANNALKYSASVKQIQARMLEDFSISRLLRDIGELFWNNNEDGEIISNAELKFKNVPVLELHLSDKPKDTIYLKDFYGSRYVGGRWIVDDEDFEKAAKKAGYDVADIKANIEYMGIQTILWRQDYGVLIGSAESIDGRLKYLKKNDESAYVPYFSYPISSKVSAEGDLYYTKPKDVEEIKYSMWNPGASYGVYSADIYNIPKEGWEVWYEKYVKDNYLEVPSNMSNIESIAKEIKEERNLSDIDGSSGENQQRIRAAEVVADWFANNAEYTVKPPSLPRNADPVEYFVGTSKEGYCMHYASAAVLILRELGVPARYASGYYVSKSIFEEKDGEQVGVIIDNTAHAWVEIYLERIGWVPIEVTTSYRGNNDTNPNIPNNDGDNEKPSDENNSEPNTENQSSESGDNETQPNETTSTPNETVGEKVTDESGNVVNKENTTKGAGYYGTGNGALKNGIIGKVLLFASIALLVGAAVYMIIRYKRRQEQKLNILISKKRTVRAIRSINEKMYKGLKKKGKLIGSNHTDASYKEILIKTYPQITKEEWDKYMIIVREVAFSNNEEAVENMEFCYEIYKRVRR